MRRSAAQCYPLNSRKAQMRLASRSNRKVTELPCNHPRLCQQQRHSVVSLLSSSLFLCLRRAPELLFRSKFHGPAIDMWSVGCIFAELLLRQPLFPSPLLSDRDQMAHVIRLLGSPHDPLPPLTEPERAPPGPRQQPFVGVNTGAYSIAGSVVPSLVSGNGANSSGVADVSSSSSQADGGRIGSSAAGGSSTSAPATLPPPPPVMQWPGCSTLPGYAEFEARQTQPWAEILRSASSSASPLAVHLLASMLAYDPAARISAEQALRHPWFSAAPPPAAPQQLPLPAGARDRR